MTAKKNHFCEASTIEAQSKPSQETMNDVYDLLNTINDKEVDYAKYDWGYHGAPRRVEADEADFVLPF